MKPFSTSHQVLFPGVDFLAETGGTPLKGELNSLIYAFALTRGEWLLASSLVRASSTKLKQRLEMYMAELNVAANNTTGWMNDIDGDLLVEVGKHVQLPDHQGAIPAVEDGAA